LSLEDDLKLVQRQNSILRSLSHRDCDKGACDPISSPPVLPRKVLSEDESQDVETFSKAANAFEPLPDSSHLITTLSQLRDALAAAETATARIERSADCSRPPVSPSGISSIESSQGFLRQMSPSTGFFSTSQCSPLRTSPGSSKSGSLSPSRVRPRHCSAIAARAQSDQFSSNHSEDWESERHREHATRSNQRGAVESSHVAKFPRHAAMISAPGSPFVYAH